MPATSLLIGLFLLALAVVVVAAPLRGRKRSARPAATPRSRGGPRHSLPSYEDRLSALRDLEFDYQLGIVAEDDHARVREHLMAEAAKALRKRCCPKCDKHAAAADRFCGACGARLTTAKVRAG